MLNIERYKEELKKCKRIYLDCEIYKIREKCEGEESGFCFSNPCSACREDNIEWLCSEYKEQILNDAEKCYLRGVIRPFRNRVLNIQKKSNSTFKEWISILIKDHEVISLPYFEKSSGMYQGMEIDKRYTLEELGL